MAREFLEDGSRDSRFLLYRSAPRAGSLQNIDNTRADMNLSLRARVQLGPGITPAASGPFFRKWVTEIAASGLCGLIMISSPEAADSQKQGLAKIAALQNQVETRSGGEGAWSP